MSNELKLVTPHQSFKSALFPNKEIRVFGTAEEPLFVGKDITDMLGYSNSRDALAKHVKSSHKKAAGQTVAIRDSLNLRTNTTLIDEAGLYSLILRSKLPKAEAFQEWVTSEILPSIRKTGSYHIDEENRYLRNTIRVLEEDRTKMQERIILAQAKEFQKYVSPEQFEGDNVFYISYIGMRDGKLLFKYGRTETYGTRRIKHSKTFDKFELLFLKSVSSGILSEKFLKKCMMDLGGHTHFGTCMEIFEISDANELNNILDSVNNHIRDTNKFVSLHEHEVAIMRKEIEILRREVYLLRQSNEIMGERIVSSGSCNRCNEDIPKDNECSMYCDSCYERVVP